MNKCLLFTLPSGAGGMAAGMTRGSIMRKLRELKFNYKHKTQAYKFKVWLENESDYTYFYLIWEPSNPYHKPTLIEEDYVEDEGRNPWRESDKKT